MLGAGGGLACEGYRFDVQIFLDACYDVTCLLFKSLLVIPTHGINYRIVSYYVSS